MTAWRRILADKRAVVTTLGAALLVNLALSAVLAYHLRGAVATEEAHAATAARERAEADRAAREATATAAALEEAERSLAGLRQSRLPADKAAARRLLYLELAELAAETNLLVTRRTLAEVDKESPTLRRLEMSVALEGSYRDVRAFIHRLETGRGFVVVGELAMARADDPEAPIELTLKASTFYPVTTDGR